MNGFLRGLGRFLIGMAAGANQDLNRSNYPNARSFGFIDDRVNIQVLDDSGMWRTEATSQNNPQVYLTRAEEGRYRYPNTRVRVVDCSNNRIVDIL